VTVAVTFPKQGVFIQYIRPYPDSSSNFDIRAHYAAIARQDSYFHVLDVEGVPALAADQNSDETGHNFGLVAFAGGGVETRVFGHYGEKTLEAVAQSIVDRAPRAQTTPPTQLAGPLAPEIHVGSVAEADAQLPFKVVLPSARPLVMVVARAQQTANPSFSGFFDTPATGPYEVVEQPADASGGIQSVAQLRTWARTCRSRVVCPIHKIVVVHGSHVLLIGAPGRPGGLTAFWLRGDRPGSILTWIQGPTDYANGDLPRHRFEPSAALAVAASVIARGG
jgi:hypothetical protein